MHLFYDGKDVAHSHYGLKCIMVIGVLPLDLGTGQGTRAPKCFPCIRGQEERSSLQLGSIGLREGPLWVGHFPGSDDKVLPGGSGRSISGVWSLLPPEKTGQLSSACSQLPTFCVTLASHPGQRPPFPGRYGGLAPAALESQWAPCSQI